MKGLLLYFVLLGGALALFYFVPGLDLWASRLFYEPGVGFPLAHAPPILFLHRAIPWLTRGLVLLIAFAAAWLFLMERPLWRLDRKALLFLAAAFALGPGLLVNTVFKDHWGRARPFQIEAFGGSRQFTPAGVPAAECARNCSFVSGDAGLGFGFLAFAFLLPPGRGRRRGRVAALAFGGAVGLGRIAAGAHFLSDVVGAGLLVYGSTWLLYRFIVVADALAAPALLRTYRSVGYFLAEGYRWTRDDAAARLWLLLAAMAGFALISIAAFDRPVALFFEGVGPGVERLFDRVGRFGLGYPYLLLFGFLFVALHWGGALPRLSPFAARMRAFSPLPAFLFGAVAVSGIAADIAKVIFGRTRPKLLISSHLYAFTWFSLRPDHWSFPSGHTVTATALAASFFLLWPRHLLVYILFAAIVAASRLIVGEHYLSDLVAGAAIGLASARCVAKLFALGGIDLETARRGFAQRAPAWPCRYLGRRRMPRAEPEER